MSIRILYDTQNNITKKSLSFTKSLISLTGLKIKNEGIGRKNLTFPIPVKKISIREFVTSFPVKIDLILAVVLNNMIILANRTMNKKTVLTTKNNFIRKRLKIN
jgi:hypothetical protein